MDKTDYIPRNSVVENMEKYPWDTEHDRNVAIHIVSELVSAADVIRVVKCRYCMYWRGPGTTCRGICVNFGADGFCSFGKRW